MRFHNQYAANKRTRTCVRRRARRDYAPTPENIDGHERGVDQQELWRVSDKLGSHHSRCFSALERGKDSFQQPHDLYGCERQSPVTQASEV